MTSRITTRRGLRRLSAALGALTATAGLAVAAPAHAADGFGIQAYEGLCVTTTGANGNVVQAQGCAGRSEQQWTRASDGSMRNGTQCLDMRADRAYAGVPATVYACNSSSRQRWDVVSSTQLRHRDSGLCLTLENWNGAPGQLQGCQGWSTQQFHALAGAGAGGETQPQPQDPGSSTRPVGSVPGNSWSLLFEDNFDGALDRSTWTPGWYGTGVTRAVNDSSFECNNSNNVWTYGGRAALSMHYGPENCGAGWAPWSSAIMTTNGNFQFTYGYAEARIYVPYQNGDQILNWPSFWLSSNNWPDGGEIDVFEGTVDGFQPNTHYRGDDGRPARSGPVIVPGNYTGWHTFAVDWQPAQVTWYYDGQPVWSVNHHVPSGSEFLILSQGAGGEQWHHLVPAVMEVDYVRVWQRR